jgi:hypothetical protein
VTFLFLYRLFVVVFCVAALCVFAFLVLCYDFHMKTMDFRHVISVCLFIMMSNMLSYDMPLRCDFRVVTSSTLSARNRSLVRLYPHFFVGEFFLIYVVCVCLHILYVSITYWLWVIWRVSYKKQVNLIRRKHLDSHRFLCIFAFLSLCYDFHIKTLFVFVCV